MIIIAYIVGFLLFFHGTYQIVKYLVVVSEIKKCATPKKHSEKLHKILVLVPVLHEEKNIEILLHNLSCQDYPKNYYEVYVVTTQKEYLDGSRPNTIDILDRIISENKFPRLRISRIHYPNISGFKTHQLGFSFSHIRKVYGDQDVSKYFFLLLDADSEVDINTLRRFNDSIEDNIEIYQQPLLWLKNIDAIKSPLMQSFAFAQSFFSLSYEIPMFSERFFPWRLKYLVGHGLFIKGSFLIRVGGFPDIIEDVRIGRLSSFLNIKLKLVPGFGIVETAKKLKIYIKQSSVWFFGCGLFINDYLYAQKILNQKRNGKLRDYVLILYGSFKAFRWLNKGLFHLIGIALSIYYILSPLAILFILSLIINATIPVLLVLRDFQDIWRKKLNKNKNEKELLFNSVFFSPILYTLNFIGLYYGLFKLLKFYSCGQVTLPKTER